MATDSSTSEPSPLPSSDASSVPLSLDPYANPLYLHAADSSSISLVTDKLIDESNYNFWATSMIQVLTAKNKLGFIYGTIPQPLESHGEYGAWIRCNAIVGTWINNSVSPDVKTMIMYIENAHLKWTTLETQFKQKNASKIFHIEQQIESLQQGSLDLNTFYTKLNSLWEELKMHDPVPVCVCGSCTCDSKTRLMDYYDKKNVVRFLMKLTEFFHPARRQILMLDPMPSIRKVYGMVAQEEHQRIALPPIHDSVVFQANISPTFRPRPFSSSKSRPFCTHCGISGHTISRCYKIHGYPPSNRLPPSSKPGLLPKPRFSTSDNTQNVVNMVGLDDDISARSQSVLPDNSAQTTLAQAQALFDQFQNQLKGLSSSAMDSNVPASPSHPAPAFHFNLLSVSALTRDTPFTVSFSHDSYMIQDPTQALMIGRGKKRHNLYFLELQGIPSSSSPVFPDALCTALSAPASIDLWHTRLGHPSFLRVQALGSSS
ncbi:PREDICTED: uncharacterized protein LOC104810602 [Tarenaya hassleriana]|uniref:uncharacterized protein LOC104810602 n=1 Tax=Tarenaya hassleriana TaxID=28532 RepID=UPI00053C4444|nr:PREDICTED: uncharacterized protein LOC104810602 [Tarenaya hassleriana]